MVLLSFLASFSQSVRLPREPDRNFARDVGYVPSRYAAASTLQSQTTKPKRTADFMMTCADDLHHRIPGQRSDSGGENRYDVTANARSSTRGAEGSSTSGRPLPAAPKEDPRTLGKLPKKTSHV